MPLVQWVMQNLQSRKGAVGGGTAAVQAIYNSIASSGVELGGTALEFVIHNPPSGVLCGGSAFYNKVSTIIATGGGTGGGSAYVSSHPGHRKKLRHLPGDPVYDKNNKTWVVISFEFAPSGEPKFVVGNNITQKVLFESELSTQPVYVLGDDFLDSPMSNLPVFAGRRIVAFGSPELLNGLMASTTARIEALKSPLANLPVFAGQQIQTTATATKAIPSVTDRIEDLKNQPLVNLPVYAGRKTVEFEERPEVPLAVGVLPPPSNLPVYTGIRKVKI